MKPVIFFRCFGIVFSLLISPAMVLAQGANEDTLKRGQYIFALAGGCACHTIPEKTPHAGSRKFPVPMGTAYSTNITQDKETGLGNWSDQEIHDAIIKGIRPNGERVLPVMPYEAYSGMAEEDLSALIAYMRTLKPVRQATPASQFQVPFVRSLMTPLWLKLFSRFSTSPKRAPKSGIERGKYLVDHVALCGDCHTPRNSLGAPKRSLYLAGARNGPLGEDIPNITPDETTGIKDWTRDQIADLLIEGTKPDGDEVQGLMAEVIWGTPLGYKDMDRDDALAIADYLKSLPPIVNAIE